MSHPLLKRGSNVKWEILEQVADRIQADLDSFDMMYYYTDICGTAACVGGHIVWMTDEEKFFELSKSGSLFSKGERIETEALKILGVDSSTRPFSSQVVAMLFTGGDISMDFIEENKCDVPNVLRWMAKNKSLNWRDAFSVLGKDFPMYPTLMDYKP